MPNAHKEILAEPLPGSGRTQTERLSPAFAVIDGQPVNVLNPTDAIAKIIARLAEPKSFMVCTLNLDHLVKRREDFLFRSAYATAELVTPDGFPIVLLARLQGKKMERTTGADLIEPLCREAAARGLPVFLFGTTDSVLRASTDRLIRQFPRLQICGSFAPPSNFDPNAQNAGEIIARIAASKARICLVALGAPRQELFAARALPETAGVAFLGVGASLDFIAGHQTRCPAWLRRLNLEWAWRLASSPRRLGLRYLKCALLFAELFARSLVNRA